MSTYPQDEEKTNEQTSLLQGNRELAVLYDIAGYLNHQIDVQQALQEVLTRVTEWLGLRTGWVWLVEQPETDGATQREKSSSTPDEQKQSAKASLVASYNLPPYLSEHPERMCGSCACLDTFLSGDMARASNIDVLRCSRLKNAERDSDPSALGLRFHASIPIYAGEMPLGVLNVASEDWRELRSDELQLLHIISDQMGIAMQRARLSEEQTRSAARLATIEERNRLAREIHDTLAQGLAAISLQLETADALAISRPERAHEAIQRALKLARSNLEEARRSVMDLRAGPLQEHTLPEAIEKLLLTDIALPVHYNHIPAHHFPLLPARVEAGLYRIVQEALTNVRKHANAQEVEVVLIAEEQWINLIVRDNGCGFDPENVTQQKGASSGHFGLTGIAERVKLLGGSICILSAPSEGTCIEVSVPY